MEWWLNYLAQTEFVHTGNSTAMIAVLSSNILAAVPYQLTGSTETAVVLK